MLKGFTKQEKSWMMYDWANSAHVIVVVTILPIFFKTVFGNNTSALTVWGFATSGVKLAIAILAPLLGALADFKDMKKRLFTFFVSIGVLSCLALAGLPFSPQWQAILAVYVIGVLGFAGANIFYDGFLPEITTPERMDKVSLYGYGMGYIGGSTIPFVIFLVLSMLIKMEWAMSISFALTGVWWGVFTIPMLKNVKQTHYVERKKGMIAESFTRIFQTLKNIKQYKSLFLFLLAYFFYIDGVGTIIYMSTIYGGSLGIDDTQMMLALLMVQLLGFPFAILYGKLAKRFGTRAMIGVGIIIYFGICIMGFGISETWHFWALALGVATSQGGIQALSRSLYGKMIPDKNRSNEFFGFFEIFGKFSAIIGPALFGLVAKVASDIIIKKNPGMTEELLAKASTPYGVLSVLVVFIIGGALFYASCRRSKMDERERQAANASA